MNNVPLMLSVQQEKFVSLLKNNQEFILECGWGTNGINRVVDIFFTKTYYAFDKLMLNDLRTHAKKAGLIL